MRCCSHFYPRSPCGERHLNLDWILETLKFLSTLSLRRATTRIFGNLTTCLIFLSTLSLRRATICDKGAFGLVKFLSTLSLRRATTLTWDVAGSLDISIHALLAESDRKHMVGEHLRVISIHALLAESDLPLCTSYNAVSTFLSTLSLRRATLCPKNGRKRHNNFYPRSPCGERHRKAKNPERCKKFLSTLSLRRATGYTDYIKPRNGISIHALLAESDSKSAQNSGALLRI